MKSTQGISLEQTRLYRVLKRDEATSTDLGAPFTFDLMALHPNA